MWHAMQEALLMQRVCVYVCVCVCVCLCVGTRQQTSAYLLVGL